MHEALAWIGITIGRSSLNLSFLLAIAASVVVWVLIWHTRWGYEIRTVGANPTAAIYAGIFARPQHHPGHGDLRRARRHGRRE